MKGSCLGVVGSAIGPQFEFRDAFGLVNKQLSHQYMGRVLLVFAI